MAVIIMFLQSPQTMKLYQFDGIEHKGKGDDEKDHH
jgi:hypothetical protein